MPSRTESAAKTVVLNDNGPKKDYLLLLTESDKTRAINFQQLIASFQTTILNNRQLITNRKSCITQQTSTSQRTTNDSPVPETGIRNPAPSSATISLQWFHCVIQSQKLAAVNIHMRRVPEIGTIFTPY